MTLRTILITGASSGIGRGLALSLARHDTILHLGGRDRGRLDATVEACRRLGADARPHVLDVTDRAGMERWIREVGADRLDMVFASAGITGGAHARDDEGAAFETAGQIRRIIAVDLDGALNTILPALDIMKGQDRDGQGRRGQICAISSVAGLVSYPGTASYSAAKAALDRFMVATGAYAGKAGIHLTSVCCAFVDTPMVARNRFPMPGLVSVNKAVRIILRGVALRKRRVIFPRWLVMGSRFMDMLPVGVAEAYYLRQPTGKPGSLPPVEEKG
ncbi:SDR family NAD(P)-dependent oxidoreductase [Brytella acorum]|uniref:SDR family NAD(P)-dependent oxidoreductase n=1 Tax=Brytella acorum TaxID=2959299 RepID=A0AA35UE05_9PROT|nr:SDR family NAD(P)-dependent oxidoreductase [Brytella acorum]MDF3625327.1 SDR family NAD(P)-dependent oxidoreductase [Brytella acorum]CAI9119259.1 SDR family NAD(P)-dependent oxidoreductase [Brytella acorum]